MPEMYYAAAILSADPALNTTTAIVGVAGEHRAPGEVEAVLADRKSTWKPMRPRHDSGILALYARVARGASEGASIT